MADPTPVKISDLAPISTGSVQLDDLLPVVDVHDTTQAASGSTKKMTLSQLFAAMPAVAASGGGTGLTAVGAANQVLFVNSGGSALEYRTPTTAMLADFPDRGGQGGKYLTTDGSTLSWGAVSGGGGGSGTVTSVALGLPGIFTVTGSPVTTSGTLTAALTSQNVNLVLAGPSSGSPATPGFRLLTSTDIPVIAQGQVTNLPSDLSTLSSGVASKEPAITGGDASQYWRGDKSWQTLATAVVGALPAQASHSGQYLTTDGTNLSWAAVAGGGGGTVNSVGLVMPAIFTVTNSPVTTTGSLTATLASQSANQVWAGPTTGSASPAFRALVASDIPAIPESGVTNLVSDLASKATDSLVMHLAGTETITGTKTFGATIVGSITGNAATSTLAGGLSAPLAVASGGTGQTTASAAFNALSPLTTLGDVAYASGANTVTRLAGNTTTTKKFQTQTGTGTVSAAPVWSTIAAADLPTLGLTIGTSYSPSVADTDGATITFNLAAGNWHRVVLGGNRTLAVSTPTVGQNFTIQLVQDATGSRTVTWFAGIKWAGGSPPTLTTAANGIDLLTFRYESSGVYLGMVAGQGFA